MNPNVLQPDASRARGVLAHKRKHVMRLACRGHLWGRQHCSNLSRAAISALHRLPAPGHQLMALGVWWVQAPGVERVFGSGPCEQSASEHLVRTWYASTLFNLMLLWVGGHLRSWGWRRESSTAVAVSNESVI